MTAYDVAPPPKRLTDQTQLRVAFSTDRGTVTRFLVQLEYWLAGEWRVVVRYNRGSPGGHDVTEAGLHRDVFRHGEKIRSESVTRPIPAIEGFNYAEVDLREHAERYIRRFEQWHDVDGGTGP